MATLEKRVSAARRGLRPLGLVLSRWSTDLSSGHPQPSDPTVVASALVETLREADTVARLDDGRFAVLLEDTPGERCHLDRSNGCAAASARTIPATPCGRACRATRRTRSSRPSHGPGRAAP